MLDAEILCLVEAMLEPGLSAQEEALHERVGVVINQGALDGLGRSSVLIKAIHQEHIRALNARAELVWSTIADVVSSCDFAWSTNTLEDLKSAWRAHFEPFVEELAGDLEHRANLMGFLKISLPDLRGEAGKIIGMTEAKIVLFERQLRRNPPRYLQANRITEEIQSQVDGDSVQSEKDMEGIYLCLFNHPERCVFLYEREGSPSNIIKGAIDAGDLLIDETTLYYHKNIPGPLFTRIDPNTTDSREREILATRPLYVRHQLRLSPRKKRQLETLERLRLEKELDDSAGVELKPGWMGISVDIWKFLKWARRRLGR